MSETLELKASIRDVIGKAAQRMKGSGLIPAVLYGQGRETISLSFDRHEVEQMLIHTAGHNTVFKIVVEGEAKAVDAVIKSVHRHPTKEIVEHIDFLAVSLTEPIHASVAVHFVGDSPGVRAGGVFSANLREIEIEALPNAIPDSLEADTSELEIGSNLHVSALVIPAGVTVLTDPETVLCSIVAPRVEVEEEVAAEETAEPEVIGGKGGEEEE